MSYIQYGLASAAIFTIGIVAGVLAIVYIQPMIKNKLLAGVAFASIAAAVGWFSSWIVGRFL